MSNILLKPYTDEERANFIVEFNHQKGLKIIENDVGVYALEPNEILLNGAVEINPFYEKEQAIIKVKMEISQIERELEELDTKRIRAICEPNIKNEDTGETWLDYYNIQVQLKRARIQELKGTLDDLANKDLSALDSREQ